MKDTLMEEYQQEGTKDIPERASAEEMEEQLEHEMVEGASHLDDLES
jgi:hypothetical protein